MYKEVVFCLACCTVCNNLTLLSLLSFTICLALFSHLSLSLSQLSLLFVIFCNAHMVAHHTILWFCFDSTPPLLSTSSFSCLLSLSLSRSPSLYLSVMAYQDGFYGAADLYVSIPLSFLLPHCSPTFPPTVACGFSSVKRQRPNP